MKNPQSKSHFEDSSFSSCGAATKEKGLSTIIPQLRLYLSAFIQESHFDTGLFVSILLEAPYSHDYHQQIRLPMQKDYDPIEESTKALRFGLSRLDKRHPSQVFYSTDTEPDFSAIDISDFSSIKFEFIAPLDNPSYRPLRDFVRKHGTY